MTRRRRGGWVSALCAITGKRKLSRSDAKRALDDMLSDPRMPTEHQKTLNVYRCGFCRRHHIGNKHGGRALN